MENDPSNIHNASKIILIFSIIVIGLAAFVGPYYEHHELILSGLEYFSLSFFILLITINLCPKYEYILYIMTFFLLLIPYVNSEFFNVNGQQVQATFKDSEISDVLTNIINAKTTEDKQILSNEAWEKYFSENAYIELKQIDIDGNATAPIKYIENGMPNGKNFFKYLVIDNSFTSFTIREMKKDNITKKVTSLCLTASVNGSFKK